MSWETKKLGEVCELYQPQTISKKQMNEQGKYLVYGANGIIGRYNEYNHESSQLLIGCRGTCGSVNVSQPFSWVTGNAMVVKPKFNFIDIKYLEYFFRGAVDLTKAITGAAQPQITRQSLSPVMFSYPTLDEQHAIVGKLDAMFTNIDKSVALTQQTTQEVNSLKKSLLTNLLQPANSDCTKDWRLVTIGDVSSFVRGLTYSKKDEVVKSKTAVLRATNINLPTCEIDLSEIRYISDDVNIKYEKFVKQEDILICTASGSKSHLGKVALIAENLGMAFGGFMGVLRANEKILPDYLYKVLTSPKFIKHLLALSDGSNINNLKFSQIKNFSFKLPEKTKQHAIVKELNTVFSEVKKLKSICVEKEKNCSALKNALLRKMLSEHSEVAS